MEATDRDSGDNGRIRYSLVSQLPESHFSIDQDGYIRTTQALDRESVDEYKVVFFSLLFIKT